MRCRPGHDLPAKQVVASYLLGHDLPAEKVMASLVSSGHFRRVPGYLWQVPVGVPM
ncbi:hypothetical protein PCANC_26037 [Puccinia coronata f. sp. avenae]|uniref:Uncharacterized protein n=1 Tax=Puccinia coronata f. sp. avenae TaxID=200324 RepID=A0A2N5S4V0_9BASI|nr:hypothetical protein PCANC_26037 [Puccinia coronata f. sp. avenae]